ncbi:hypothetical protein [Streptomyces malaysiensis]|uniref:hypothetical protein n=1 Tax=Streptomyces malaysiensis TaxID=92644 RepID=UPI00368B78AD
MADTIRVTVVFEYEPFKDNYPDCSSVEDMARLDESINNWVEYPETYDDDLVSVTYEAITNES